MNSRAARTALCLMAAFGFSVSASAETWHRADTHHFTIYSDGRSGQLEDFAHEAEKFDALLRMIFKRPVKEEPAKLVIYLLDDSDDVSRLSRSNAAGFYSVRPAQTFAVGNRAYGSDKSDLSGKRVLFHEYAHHFMYHNFAIPAPAWFSEGFAEFVATADFKRSGKWTFGEPAHHRAWSVQNGPSVPIEVLLTSDYDEMTNAETSAFYGWAWALTHMFYSDPDERGDQIVRYLRDINRGMDNLEAAEKNFGDLEKLEKSLKSYVRKSMAYSKSDREIPYRNSVSVTQLPDFASELIGLRLERLTSTDKDGLHRKLTSLAARANSADAWYEVAELEYMKEHGSKEEDDVHDFAAAETAVDRALALDGDHAKALVLKGRLLLEPFDHDDDPDEANWEHARAYFLRANQSDPSDAYALYLWANTFQREGKRDDMTGPALETAFGFRPESRAFRSALAMHYASEGQYDRAIGLLNIIANNPHGGGKWAKDTIASLRQAQAGGSPLIPLMSSDEVNDEKPEDDE